MKTITIQGTDMTTSRIGFGTASLHHVFSARRRRDLLAAAVHAGLTHVDTAPYYGDGLAEHDIGSMGSDFRRGITLVTKVGIYAQGNAVNSAMRLWIRRTFRKATGIASAAIHDFAVSVSRASLEASLRRLRTDHVDLLLLHEPTFESVTREPLFEWLADERRRGRIRAWGIAGDRSHIEPFIRKFPELVPVIQTRDSLVAREADFLTALGRKPQITFGYLRRRGECSAGDALRAALARYRDATILYSTRKPDRLASVAKVLD
jgi:aryl-alcohol dehydrogenase-like predicted oxidoreductase